MTSNYKKMISGIVHDGADPELFALQAEAQKRLAKLEAIPLSNIQGRVTAMAEFVGDPAAIALTVSPFYAEYGTHLKLGKWVYINKGATFLDSAHISIGDYTAIGPNVQLITAGHPVRPENRHIFDVPEDNIPPFRIRNIAKPIIIGKNCWLGAGVIVLPGVTIGDGTTIGAGSVVTKSIPERVIAVGNPARVIKSVDEYDDGPDV